MNVEVKLGYLAQKRMKKLYGKNRACEIALAKISAKLIKLNFSKDLLDTSKKMDAK